uniref:DUF4290 domain-containing protein n=1 Tax=Fulvivirga sp. TaxID=1931237 RepID=UPI00404ABDD6
MEYNTDREGLKLMEYGRNVHRLIEHIKTIEDKPKRSQYAETIVELMKLINPTMKESPEYAQKLWDDLYIMSGFDLDIDSPFPMPTPNADKKPQRLAYPALDVRYKHYGKNIELLIEKAVALESEEDKEAAAIHIGKMMKAFYAAWNKENVDDAIIIKNLVDLSKNRLSVDIEKVREHNLFESAKVFREPRNDRDMNSGDRNRRNKPSNGKKIFKRRRPS